MTYDPTSDVINNLINNFKIGWVQVSPYVTLSNITPHNNLLYNSYYENLTIELHVLYVLNIHANFHVNWILFTIQFINSSFKNYFKL